MAHGQGVLPKTAGGGRLSSTPPLRGVPLPSTTHLRPGTVRLEEHRLLVAAPAGPGRSGPARPFSLSPPPCAGGDLHSLLARVVLGPRQGGVLGHVGNDLGQFAAEKARGNHARQTRPTRANAAPHPTRGCHHSLHFVRDFVDVDAAIIGFLLVIAIPALRASKCGGNGGPRGGGRNARDHPRKFRAKGRVGSS